MLQARVFSSAGPAAKIDLENRIIKDVVMGQVGEAEGHGVHVEEEFLQDAAKWFTSNQPDGVKANFGHNYENVGLTLGRFKNIRYEKGKLVGDLHLHKSADLSPNNPGQATWLMEMGKEDPGAVMSSLVFAPSMYYQKTDSGQKIQVWYYDDEDNWISKNSALGKVYVGFAEGRSCDIVENGAITDSLFTGNALLNEFQNIINNPQFPAMIEQYGDKFPILAEHYSTKQKTSLWAAIKKFLNPEPMEENTQQTQEETLNQQDQSTEEQNDSTGFEAKYNARIDELTKKFEAANSEIDALKKKLSEVSNEAADEHSGQRGHSNEKKYSGTHPANERLKNLSRERMNILDPDFFN